MTPRIHNLLSPADRDVLSSWRRRVFAVYALLAAALIGYLMLTAGTRTVAEGSSKDEQARAETCAQHTGALPDAADRQMPGQVAQDAMPTCVPAADLATGSQGSTRQPQAN
jgi:hypothetical protein